MPIYVLRCTRCGEEQEVLVDTFIECPSRCAQCNGVLKRVWDGPPMLRFKGDGFYVNDYGKKEKGKSSGYIRHYTQAS